MPSELPCFGKHVNALRAGIKPVGDEQWLSLPQSLLETWRSQLAAVWQVHGPLSSWAETNLSCARQRALQHIINTGCNWNP